MSEYSTTRTGGLFLKVILPPCLVLAAGAVGMWYLFVTMPEPKKVEVRREATPVEVVPAELTSEVVYVRARGTVVPARKISLRPQVSGRIVEKNPDLVPGGIIRKGEVIARIEPEDYELRVKRARAQLKRARSELKLERGNQVVARREWELAGNDVNPEMANKELALRKPQLEMKNAAVELAMNDLKQAELDHERTTIRAPFNSLVKEEDIDTGQLVNQQTTMAMLVGTDRFWIRVSVPVSKLPYIKPPARKRGRGASARITYSVGEFTVEDEGYVSRILKDIDPKGRMAGVLVTVEDPLRLKEPGKVRLPLLLGGYVRVEIDAGKLDRVIAVDRKGIREGDKVWVMDSGNRLAFRSVEIVWSLEKRVLVRGGIKEKDRIVISRIAVPVEGMKLQAVEKTGGEGGPGSGESMAEVLERGGKKSL